MFLFAYSGCVADHESEWRVLGKVFPRGVPVLVSDREAGKLRALGYFDELSLAAGLPPMVDDAPEQASTDRSGEHPGLQNLDGEGRHLGSVPEPVKRKRGRPPGSKNKPKVMNGDTDEG